MNQQIKAYTRATHTAARTRQVVMLYEGMIRFLQQAKEAMEQNAIEQRYLKLTKASDIVVGLQACLDFENGGTTAQVLYDFYGMIDRRIFALHRSNDAAACGALIEELRQMRDVWDEIDRGAATAKTAKTPAAPALTAPTDPVIVSA